MIFKNDIPILEFDTDKTSVIAPTHEKLDLKLPRKAVFAFLGEYVEEFAKRNGCVQVGEFTSETKDYPLYVCNRGGTDILICQAPVGAAAATQILDWLIGYGVREIISSGACGALAEFEENVFLVPTRALRDEGTSYHYMPPSRFAEMNVSALQAIKEALYERGYPYREVTTWSTDGFYRETPYKVEYRKQEGCDVVEMECSALAACAAFRGAVWGCILYTADTLADVQNYDERNWGEDSRAAALELCLDAVVKI
ncbi:MAG: nucleoside phosphorylase [Clostridia bacterium]|nr:nucleoside phosphorylase [Clostridia bacterium]